MKKIRIIAVISAIIAFICGFMFLSSQSSENQSNKKSSSQISVVVAIEDITPYTAITSEMLTLKDIAPSEGLIDYYSSVDELVGKVCISDVFSGEVVTKSRIVEADDPSLGLSSQLNAGMRAVTIEVDIEQGVAGNIKVGNYVDIIYISQLQEQSEGDDNNGSESGQEDGDALSAGEFFTENYGKGLPVNTQVLSEFAGQYYSNITLQNVKVAAIDDVFYFNKNSISEEETYGSITLEVTPSQAAKIALLNDNDGKIQLVLRPQNDQSTVNEGRGYVLGS